MQRVLIIIFFSVGALFAKSQALDSTALVLIDIQEFYFPGGAAELVQPEKAAKNASEVLNFFRKNDGLVVHVRHNFEPGGSIHSLVEPNPSEKVFTKNEVNAFLDTGLNDYLQNKHIRKLVLCGMQTHMCLEAATRAAHDLGYNCTVIGDACATRDLTYGNVTVKAGDVHASTLATLKNYAEILNTKDYIGASDK